MWFAVYTVCHGKTAVPDIEPLGTWLSVCACFVCARCDLSHMCVFIRPGQTALNHCRSQRQRKTLMLSHSDTYLTPLSWTLTVLRADVCALVCRAVTSHQTAAPRPLAYSLFSPLQSYFPSPLFHFAVLFLQSFTSIDINLTLKDLDTESFHCMKHVGVVHCRYTQSNRCRRILSILLCSKCWTSTKQTEI